MTSQLVVITGVGKGFGRELVKALARDFQVIGLSRTQSDLDALQDELTVLGLTANLICIDVTDFDHVSERLGEELRNINKPVYGLINNAGMRCRKKFSDLTLSDFLEVSNVNLFAAINLCSIVLPAMLSQNAGRIINVSSILSKSALPELSAYAVSKGGLDAFTRSLAVEYGEKQIAVNSILPGFCKTSYYPNFAKNNDLLNMTLGGLCAVGRGQQLVGSQVSFI